MFYNTEDFVQGNGTGENIDINITNTNFNDNQNYNMNMNTNDNSMMMTGTVQGPIIEPGRERVIQRNIVHEVKQEIPFLHDNYLNVYFK